MTLWCGIQGQTTGQKGQRHEPRRVLLPRCGPPDPVLRSLDRRPSGADRVAGMTHIGWMVTTEFGVCILLTRRREEMQYWVDRGCTAVPLYAMPSL